jgi:hypothetical protein
MLKVSKKADLFNADSILYCLSQGPQSNADNTVGPGFNNSTVTDYLEGDPVVTNGNFDYAAYGNSIRLSKYYYNLLTNLRGSGVIDPRMPKIVPASMANVQLNGSGQVSSYTWNRSIGVDSYDTATRLLKGGATSIQTATYAASNKTIIYTIANATDLANFIAAQQRVGRAYTVNGNQVSITYPAGSIYINSTNYIYAGDTAYVNMRSNALATSGNPAQPANDVNWYPSIAAYNAGVIGSTGSFQVRPVSDQDILTYYEMCFIKAEVYMRKGDPADAYTAYIAGIQANMDKMQTKLAEWQAGGFDKNAAGVIIPDMEPMNPADIAAYMTSSAVAQGPGTLTMADIMLQKYIAMGCSIENYNDMRRFDYSAGDIGNFGVVYPGYQRGPLFTGQAQLTGGSPTDPRYWMRRWALPPTYEINYNSLNTLALNPHATDPNIWSMPVWWDTPTDEAYFGYLK